MKPWKICVAANPPDDDLGERNCTVLDVSVVDGAGQLVTRFVRVVDSAHDVQEAARGAACAEVSYLLGGDAVAEVARSRVHVVKTSAPWMIRAAGIITLIAIAGWLATLSTRIGSDPPTPQRPDSWSREELVSWMTSARVADAPTAARMFDRCTEERIREAIPKAVKFSRRTVPDEARDAARRFLRCWAEQEIEEAAKRFGWSGISFEEIQKLRMER